MLSRTSDNTTSQNIGGTNAWAVPPPQILGGTVPPVPPRSPPLLPWEGVTMPGFKSLSRVDGCRCARVNGGSSLNLEIPGNGDVPRIDLSSNSTLLLFFRPSLSLLLKPVGGFRSKSDKALGMVLSV